MFESSAAPGVAFWSEIPQSMAAVICRGPEDYRLEEVPVPCPGPGEALIKVEAAGICPSDLKCYRLADFKTGLDLVGHGEESVKVTLIP
jgi:threonine dehydrogenase-like Zn-dependent dehydrogenase